MRRRYRNRCTSYKDGYRCDLQEGHVAKGDANHQCVNDEYTFLWRDTPVPKKKEPSKEGVSIKTHDLWDAKDCL